MTEQAVNTIEQGRSDLARWEENKPDNFFAADANVQRVLQMHLGPKRYALILDQLTETGQLSATRIDELARYCNRDENLPLLGLFDGIGEQTQEVVFNAAHHELGRLFWKSGVLAQLATPGHELESGALTYLLDFSGEAGHACPVACTAGLIKLLQRVGSAEQRDRLLPRLVDPDYDTMLHASQFVTEVQGGSDVGANQCLAQPAAGQPGHYRISGEKWFCSVMGAPLFVMTARLPDGPSGTAGLGLFLVPRLVEGRPNGFSIRRLKYKLGTRSLPSGEADFHGALAEPLGPLDQGFKHLVSIVLDTSRVYNAVAACAFMQRAYFEARTFAEHRRAFGQPIIQFPAVARTLARMKVHSQAALATTFRILALSSRQVRSATPDPALQAARRTHVNINKYWTALRCTDVVREGIEILGGNGTIEEFSVLPRLYRDAMVLESWEGTHNTLCAQVLRDFSQRQLHQAWLADVRSILRPITAPTLIEHTERAGALLTEVERRIDQLLSRDEVYAQEHIRLVVDRMCVLSGLACLLAELQWEHEQGLSTEKLAVVELYRTMLIDPVDPMATDELRSLYARIIA